MEISLCGRCGRADAAAAVRGVCLDSDRFLAGCALRVGQAPPDPRPMPAVAARAVPAGPATSSGKAAPASAASSWKILAVVGTLLGGTGGFALHATTAQPVPPSGTHAAPAGRASVEIDIARACVRAGRLDCASYIADLVRREDPKNADLPGLIADLAKAVTK